MVAAEQQRVGAGAWRETAGALMRAAPKLVWLHGVLTGCRGQ